MAKDIKVTGVRENTIYTKQYQHFRGVDFSKDASMVDDEHSPEAKNLISDTAGFPEKRIGWRTISRFDARINGIFSFGEEETRHMLVHAGDKIYRLRDGETELLKDGVYDNPSNGKYFKGKLCILTGREFLVYDGEKCIRASESEDMYAPITLISRGGMKTLSSDPKDNTDFIAWDQYGDFENRDGTAVEYGVVPENVGINLVSGKRKNHFCHESGCALFMLDSKIKYETRVTMRCISTDTELFSVVFKENDLKKYAATDGENRVATELFNTIKSANAPYTPYCVWIGNSEKNNCGYVFCSPNTSAIDGYTFIDGVDNYSIEFTHEVEGYAERIEKCTILDVFENRVFFSGNPDYPNVDWYSGINDPLYIPDINYTEIGVDSSRIMGYLKTGDKQAILKSDGDGATIFMRSYSTTADGKVIFPIKQGTSGLGAVAQGAVCTFLDDPLYLTRNGVYAIAMQDISSERALNIRSTSINKRLLREKELKNAAMCEWNGYLILSLGGCAYVADSAQKQEIRNSTGTFEYEWYYWTNIPARVFCSSFGELFFGTEDGRLCKFNTDIVDSEGALLGEAYSDDGEAIVAEWATNFSDDGNFMQEKTLVKKGSGIFLKTHDGSGISVFIRTEQGEEKKIAEENAEILRFDGKASPIRYCVVPFNTRVKKYGAIQIICRNDKKDHTFGIGGIIRKYFYGNTKK